MAKQSLKSIQAELLNESLLNDLGNDKTSYADINTLPVIEQLLIKTVGNFLLQVEENIKASDLPNLDKDLMKEINKIYNNEVREFVHHYW